MKVVDQNIPSELLFKYSSSLQPSTLWKPGSNIYIVNKRKPFIMPHMRSNSGNSPSGEQLEVREAFKKCIKCFNASPKTGGATPPALGYRSKEWWYNAASGSGLWYYDYFIQQSWPIFFGDETPDWCVGVCTADTFSNKYDPNQTHGTMMFMYVGKKTTVRYIGYLQTNMSNPNYLHIHADDQTEFGCETGVYKIPDDTNINGITWNNQPELGELITTFNSFVASGARKWFKIPVQKNRTIALVPHVSMGYPVVYRTINYAYDKPYFS